MTRSVNIANSVPIGSRHRHPEKKITPGHVSHIAQTPLSLSASSISAPMQFRGCCHYKTVFRKAQEQHQRKQQSPLVSLLQCFLAHFARAQRNQVPSPISLLKCQFHNCNQYPSQQKNYFVSPDSRPISTIFRHKVVVLIPNRRAVSCRDPPLALSARKTQSRSVARTASASDKIVCFTPAPP